MREFLKVSICRISGRPSNKSIDETLAQRKLAVLAALEPAVRERLQTLESQVAAIDQQARRVAASETGLRRRQFL